MVRVVSITTAVILAFVVPGVIQASAKLAAVSTMPAQLSGTQVSDIQQALNREGFSSGPVDGIWGPLTQAAMQNFQRKHNLQPTGLPGNATFAALGMADATASQAAVPAVQPAPPAAPLPSTAPVAAAANRMPGAPVTGLPNTTGTPGSLAPATNSGNPAIATTATSAPRPAAGANSFNEGEARARIGDKGFQNVGNLQKDANGVWRGTATRTGQPVNVWLDFKGDVGQQ